MGIAVREAMHIGGLARCKVVAGADGLDRTIEAVTVMEVPDVIRWLKGNVLLLTSLYPVKDDEEAIENLVGRLHMAGIAGLAIKTGQYVRHIPDAIVAAGNRLGLPIIEIDKETTYLDIMTPLMEYILSEPRPLEEQPDSYNQWLTELAMSGKGVAALIEAVERLMGGELSVGSELPARELRYGTEAAPLTVLQKKQLTAAKRPVRMERRLGGQALPCLVAPIMLSEELVGDITYRASNREFRERDIRVVERTMILIALEFLKAITTADVEQTFKDQFMADVLQGRVPDVTETIEKGRRFGWDFTSHYAVYCVAVSRRADSSERRIRETAASPQWKRRLLHQARAAFRFDEAGVVITFLKQDMVILYPQAYPPARPTAVRQAEAIHRQLASEWEELSFTIAVGRWHPGLEGIHKGYLECCRVLELGKPLRSSGVIHYDELGLFRLLSESRGSNELESLYAESVGKLADYDAAHGANLVETLTRYFAQNGSLAETAEKLFVHVNTVKYRLQKIEQLTGCSVNDAEARLLLHVGLKIRLLRLSERSEYD
ncbi:Purine catabolism regulatory protein [Paenibacillus solanacearum]|uniref:Purine catabolism regulatory protein n=1 Tax=Paenibacillus solanacearum TaxID=2048548 RepID=A0A916K3V5_9BACL|nr:PucR family transcriptional regulator ligand-binding domain-containing protein [Paenibacillus solanacearum]CAG7632280.1 Purine catabolism regulatory protein [Paenibacillus solanacearum]